MKGVHVLGLSVATLAASVALAEPQPAAPSHSQKDADTQALFERNCASCHDLTQVTSATKDAAGWAETVDRMIGIGAQVSPEDAVKIRDFLTAHYGPAPARK